MRKKYDEIGEISPIERVKGTLSNFTNKVLFLGVVGVIIYYLCTGIIVFLNFFHQETTYPNAKNPDALPKLIADTDTVLYVKIAIIVVVSLFILSRKQK